MQLSLFKPRDGWRRFAGEVGVIVLGVLLALGAQQIAEAIHWRKEVRLTEQALTNEIAASIVNIAERKMVDQCLRDRLGYLVGKLQSANPQWTAERLQLGKVSNTVTNIVPAAYRSPTRTWDQSAWESAKNSGVLSHMPRDRVAAFSSIYAMIDSERVTQDREDEAVPRLMYLSFDIALDAEGRRQAMSTLGELDWANGLLIVVGEQIIDSARLMRLDFSKTNLNRDLADIEKLQRSFRGPCVKHVTVTL